MWECEFMNMIMNACTNMNVYVNSNPCYASTVGAHF